MQIHNFLKAPKIETLRQFISNYWLVAGYVALLSGLFWLPDGSAYTKLFYALMAFPALLALALSPKCLKDMLNEPTVLGYLAFMLWLLLSLTWSQAESSPSSLAKRPIYVFMMFTACALLAYGNALRLLGALRVGAMLAVPGALAGLYTHLQLNPEESRLIGTGALTNPLLTSHVLGFFCTYWIAAWLSQNEQKNWLPVLCAIPLLIAILATGSRTPLLALVITSMWMLVMTPRRSSYLLLGLIAAALAVLVAMPELVLQRGVSFRPQLWAEAIRQANEQLLIGHGYETSFSFLVPEIGYPLSDPHNVELAVLLELGLIGLTLWLAMYAATYWGFWTLRNERSMQIASALVTYGLAAGLTEGSSFLSRPNESWFLIWIPLALATALFIQLRKSAQ